MGLSLLAVFLVVTILVILLMFWALDRLLRPLEQININIARKSRFFLQLQCM